MSGGMFEMKYPTQRLAYPFFVTMIVFFLLQVIYGLTIALQQVDPYFLENFLNFNVNRSTHINLAIIWILTGFIGTLLFVGPLIAGRDLASPWMARLLLFAIWGIVLWTAITLPLAQWGIAGWAFGQPWLQEGLEYLEAGRITDVFLLIGFVIIAYLILRIFPNVRHWDELHWGLAIGLVGLTFFWLFGLFFISALDLQEYFRWFVVHYWVEGIWEILYVSVVGFLLYTLFDADIKIVRFSVFWGIMLIVMAGLIGNGHHYFWIGTPALWQFWGSLFSALEPVPIIFGIWHIFLSSKRERKPLRNKTALYFIFGSSLFGLVGAGILGFTQTFSVTNVWEHGTWVAPAHAHLALFGTFGMLMLGVAYAVVPGVKGFQQFDDRLSKAAFWLLFTGILGMMLSFALGGTVQVYIYRVLGLDWFGAEVRPAMQFWRGLLFFFGLVFAIGVMVFSYNILTLKQKALEKPAQERKPLSWWQQPLSLLEMAGWFASLWFFGFLITGALLSFNLPSVRMGDPMLPYLLSGIGYPGLMLVTAGLALRFLRAFEGQQILLEQPQSGLDVIE